MSERRAWRLIDQAIADMGVDLHGLVVYTEAASGPYRWSPLLAARAGAERVFALAADNAHHRGADVAEATSAAAARAGLSDRVRVLRAKRPEDLALADIVTNSATLRPITREDVEALKPTAALPLMWETWEFVASDLDLDACRRRGIVVLGTHECRPPCNLVPYCGPLAVRVLFELGLEVNRTRVLLLGRQALGVEIERFLRLAGCEVETFGAYDELRAHFAAHGAGYDALLAAEAVDRALLLGPGGRLEPDAVAAVNPDLRVGVIAGTVDAVAARVAGLTVFPETVRGGGRMSYDISALGPRPVLELYAAGLRVGAVTARARLAGLDPAAAAATAVRDGVAMDFSGEPAWTARGSSSTRAADSRAAATPSGSAPAGRT